MQTKLIHQADRQRTFAVVLQTGDEAVSCLKGFAERERLNAAQITAIGALSDAILLSLAYYSDRLACCQKERTSVGRRRIRRSARRPKKLSSVKSSGQKLGSS